MGFLKRGDKKVVKIDPNHLNDDKLREAAEHLHDGGMVIFPTETVYGIGVHPSFKNTVAALYELKGRQKDKPFTLHLSNYLYLDEFHLLENAAVSFLTKKFWPGPLTLIIKDKKDKRFGYRMPRNPIALRLIELVTDPIYATSVNLSGEKPTVQAKDISKEIRDRVELIIDGGRCELAKESSIVDLSEKPYRIVRQGAESEPIEKALSELNEDHPEPKRNVLLVCTGNSCRSPMAEAWLKHMAKEKHKTGYEFYSCGIVGHEGWHVTDEAKMTCAEDKIDISSHRSRNISRELVHDADEIIAMADEHRQFILEQYPYLLGRIKVLNIADPIGKDIEFYHKTYDKIKEKLEIVYPWLKK